VRADPAQAPVDLDGEIDALLETGASVAEIARNLARRGAGDRRDLYARASARKAGRR
jgi:hypothetical protein